MVEKIKRGDQRQTSLPLVNYFPRPITNYSDYSGGPLKKEIKNGFLMRIMIDINHNAHEEFQKLFQVI